MEDVFSLARHNRYASLKAKLEVDRRLVFEQDEKGNTILLVASQNGLKKIAKLALKAGADVNHQNATGNTALHYAYLYTNQDTLGQLLNEWGADDGILNQFGQTCYEMDLSLLDGDDISALEMEQEEFPQEDGIGGLVEDYEQYADSQEEDLEYGTEAGIAQEVHAFTDEDVTYHPLDQVSDLTANDDAQLDAAANASHLQSPKPKVVIKKSGKRRPPPKGPRPDGSCPSIRPPPKQPPPKPKPATAEPLQQSSSCPELPKPEPMPIEPRGSLVEAKNIKSQSVPVMPIGPKPRPTPPKKSASKTAPLVPIPKTEPHRIIDGKTAGQRLLDRLEKPGSSPSTPVEKKSLQIELEPLERVEITIRKAEGPSPRSRKSSRVTLEPIDETSSSTEAPKSQPPKPGGPVSKTYYGSGYLAKKYLGPTKEQLARLQAEKERQKKLAEFSSPEKIQERKKLLAKKKTGDSAQAIILSPSTNHTKSPEPGNSPFQGTGNEEEALKDEQNDEPISLKQTKSEDVDSGTISVQPEVENQVLSLDDSDDEDDAEESAPTLLEHLALGDMNGLRDAIPAASEGEIQSALLNACSRKATEAVSLLVPRVPNQAISQALMICSKSGAVAPAMELLPFCQSLGMGNALIQACLHGHMGIVDILLTSHNIPKASFMRALTICCSRGHASIMQTLLPFCSDEASVLQSLQAACISNCTEIVTILLDYVDGKKLDTALYVSASKGQSEIVPVIIERILWLQDPLKSEIILHALSIAQSKGHNNILHMLSSHLPEGKALLSAHSAASLKSVLQPDNDDYYIYE